MTTNLSVYLHFFLKIFKKFILFLIFKTLRFVIISCLFTLPHHDFRYLNIKSYINYLIYLTYQLISFSLNVFVFYDLIPFRLSECVVANLQFGKLYIQIRKINKI